MNKRISLKSMGRRTILTKAWWSLLYLGIFIFGKHIPLPFVQTHTGTVNALLVATGGDASYASLFSLGISPWMSAMIIIGMLAQLKLPILSKITGKKMDFMQKVITLLLTLMQAAVMVDEFQLTSHSPLARLLVTLFLTTGTFLLIWLSVENDKNGLGGITLILMANMFFTIIKSFIGGFVPGLSEANANLVRGLVFVIIIVLGMLTVTLNKAERRVRVIKPLLSSEFGNESYLPIRFLPAASMPAMFATTMFTLPRYIFRFFYNLSKWQTFKDLAGCFDFSRPIGVLIYCLIIVGLTYGFSFISIDPIEQADNMQKSGDYIPGCRPGTETENYLKHIVNVFSFVSSIYFVILVGLPMGLTLISTTLSTLAMIPNYVIILAGFGSSIADQMAVLLIQDQYQNLL
ncbi:Preprotein translocase SecY family protein [Lactobacillus equicursoris 66c]|uniref:Accessory Sec system protein translocase subunit SecY2 n=1 Tax=Lactobacillus equicursoris 66c TaxID=872326 RepID=K0NY25_9LACO|nr:accessory Sec system protein translocase subunit SecY2 [Lactobacillus equicursoris]CCK84460.1 Preprotein translocase SecY family protein [Lactobacillus equicursoris 66c]